MPRACVIVLDAVGAGALPDAAEYGDEGSDTLGNVARAVGGLDLPNLEALGLGNVEPLEGCPPQPGAPAVAGRLVERSKGKDTTTGHWELMGVVTPQAMPTYPHGFPHDVIDPFMHRTGRGVLGNKPASGTEIIQELGEEHQRTGKWIVYTSADSVFQIAAHEETIPLEELYERAAAIAREILTGKHAVGRVIARPFAGEPGNYERTPNRHDFSLEPRRPNYLSLVRDAGEKVHGVGKISDIFAGCDIDESHPTKSNVDGINQTERLLREIDDGPRVHEPRRDGHALGPPQRPRQLPPLPPGLRPPAARTSSTRCGRATCSILTSDHGCDPTTPSTDHSREHALLLAYVAGRNAARRDPRGRVRGRRRDGERLARRQGADAGIPGTPIVDAVRLNDPAVVAERVPGRDRAAGEAPGVSRSPTGRTLVRTLAVEAVLATRPEGVLEVGCAAGRSGCAHRARAGARTSSRSTSRSGWSSSLAPGASMHVSVTYSSFRSMTATFDAALGLDALPRARSRARRRRARPCASSRRTARGCHQPGEPPPGAP